MNIADLRAELKTADKNTTETALVEIYKLLPKDSLTYADQVIRDVLAGAQAGDIQKKKSQDAFIALQNEVAEFANRAYSGYLRRYGFGNWHKRMQSCIARLSKYKPSSPYYEGAVNLLLELYEVLADGCVKPLFKTDNPFKSVFIDQPELYWRIAERMFHDGVQEKKLMKMIDLACDNRGNIYTAPYTLMFVLIRNVPKEYDSLFMKCILEYREKELQLAGNQADMADKLQKAETEDPANPLAAQSDEQKAEEVKRMEATDEEKAAYAAEFVFLLLSKRDQLQEAIKWFKENSGITDPEKLAENLFCLIGTKTPEQAEAFITEYEMAEAQGITFKEPYTEWLQEAKDKLANNDFQTY